MIFVLNNVKSRKLPMPLNGFLVVCYRRVCFAFKYPYVSSLAGRITAIRNPLASLLEKTYAFVFAGTSPLALISAILLIGSKAKVYKPVVRSNAVYMVNVNVRPRTVMQRPCDAVGYIVRVANSGPEVAMSVVRNKGPLTGIPRVPHIAGPVVGEHAPSAFFPPKKPGIRAVIYDRFKHLNRYVVFNGHGIFSIFGDVSTNAIKGQA